MGSGFRYVWNQVPVTNKITSDNRFMRTHILIMQNYNYMPNICMTINKSPISYPTPKYGVRYRSLLFIGPSV